MQKTIHDCLREIPISTLPRVLFEETMTLSVTMSVSWLETINYMCKNHISAVPIFEAGEFVGAIDRFTFVHWAALFYEGAMARAASMHEPAPDPKSIFAEIQSIFSTHPVSQMDKSLIHPVVLMSTASSCFDVAEALSRPGLFRVYLTDPATPADAPPEKRICGVITQTLFFQWLVAQPFFSHNEALARLTIRNLVESLPESDVRPKSNYAFCDLKEPSYKAIAAIKCNAADRKRASGVVMTGEDEFLVTTLRRRDVDVIARLGCLEILGEPFCRLITRVRQENVETMAASVVVTEDVGLLGVAKKLASSRFEHCFVSRDGKSVLASVKCVITDGSILRYILAH